MFNITSPFEAPFITMILCQIMLQGTEKIGTEAPFFLISMMDRIFPKEAGKKAVAQFLCLVMRFPLKEKKAKNWSVVGLTKLGECGFSFRSFALRFTHNRPASCVEIF